MNTIKAATLQHAMEVVAEDSSDVDEDLFQDYLMTTDVNPYMEYNGSQIHKSNLVNSVLNNTTKLTGCRLLRVQFDKNSAKIDEVIEANEELFRLTDTFATVTKFKLGNIAVIFLVADKIIWKKIESSIPLSKLNECTLQGKVIIFDELVGGQLKWNKSYLQ